MSRAERHAARASPLTRRWDKVMRNVVILALCASVAVAFLSLFLRLSILVVGLLAPAWRTLKALESPPAVVVIDAHHHGDDDDDAADHHLLAAAAAADPARAAALRNWQTYWVMAALLFAADGALRSTLAVFLPAGTAYAAAMFAAVTWLTRRDAENAAKLYAGVVRPLFLNSERQVDRAAETVLANLDTATARMVVAVNDVVAPLAGHIEAAAQRGGRQLEYAVAEGSRQWAEGGRERGWRRRRPSS